MKNFQFQSRWSVFQTVAALVFPSTACCCGVNKIYLDFTLKFHPSIRCLLMWADIACQDWPAAKFSVFPIYKRNRLLTSQLWTPLVLQHIRYKHVIYPKRTQIVPSSCEWLCTPHTVSRSCNSPGPSICRRITLTISSAQNINPKCPPGKHILLIINIIILCLRAAPAINIPTPESMHVCLDMLQICEKGKTWCHPPTNYTLRATFSLGLGWPTK